jgi:hypothetical protein
MNEVEHHALKVFGDALQDFVNSRKIPMEKAMRHQGKLLADKVIDFTPPRTKAAGKATVVDDVRRSVGDLSYWSKNYGPMVTNSDGTKQRANPARFKQEWINKIINSKKPLQKRAAQLTAIFARFKTGMFAGAVVSPFDPYLHSRNRTKKGGVRKIRKYAKVTLETGKVNAYVRRVQGNVGMAKGGWARALRSLGKQPLNWIGKHDSQGQFKDNLQDIKNPYLWMRNSSPWATYRGNNTIISNALQARARDIRTAMEHAATKALAAKLKRLNTLPKPT